MAKQIGRVAFESHGHRERSVGTVDGRVVIVIDKVANHTRANEAIYQVVVEEKTLAKQFRSIDAARAATEKKYVAQLTRLSDETIAATMRAIPDRPFHTWHFIAALKSVKPNLWRKLVDRYGEGGEGSGARYTAFSAVAHALRHAADRGILVKLPSYQRAPSELKWGSSVIRFWSDKLEDESGLLTGELSPGAVRLYPEGALKRVTVNAYERDERARADCIRHYGTACQACGMDFAQQYGAFGEGFIHVHHRIELHTVTQGYQVNPVEDLVPLCPNCHAMVHRRQPMLTVQELRDLLRDMRGAGT